MAATGSLGVGGGASPTVTATDCAGGVLPGVSVYLTLASAGGEATANTANCDTAFPFLGLTASRCTTDANGQVPVRYNASSPSVPNGGTDTITASLDSGGTGAASTTYTYATIDHLGLTPSPLAATGSLGVGGTVDVVATAYDSSNTPIPGVTIYLSMHSAGGELDSNFTGACAQSLISLTPVVCRTGDPSNLTAGANHDPNVKLSFFASAPSVPNGGTDTITAALDAGGTGAVTTTYTYATVDHIGLTPSPLAATGSLGVGGTVNVVATAYDSSNTPIPGITIYLSMTRVVGGKAELVSNFTGACGQSLIGATPVVCRTGDPSNLTPGANQDPNVKLRYSASSPSVPNGGTDTITAALDAGGTGAVTTTYTYATVDHIGLSPTPIAATGSLGVGGGVNVVATAYDSSNNPIGGVPIYVSFQHASGGKGELDSFATGQCGSSLISSQTVCMSGFPNDATPGANHDPNVKLKYFASSPSVPNGGTDTVTASIDAAGTGTVTTTYTYATIDHIGLAPTPIAPSGSLPLGGGVNVVATPYDSSNNPIPGVRFYVFMNNAPGSNPELNSFATNQCNPDIIGSTPALCQSGAPNNATPGANHDPNVKLTYDSSAPNVPDGGTDTITAEIDQNGTGAVTTSYTYGRATVLTYNGQTTRDHGDDATLSATLLTKADSQPVPGVSVAFNLGGSQTCSGTTDSSGKASCTIAPNEVAGGYTLTANFAGNGTYLASSTSASFTVTKEETSMSLSGPAAILAGSSSATIGAKLVEDGANDNDSDGGSGGTSPAETVTLSVGSQSCTGTTQADGTVTCTLSSITSALGPQTVTASFAGDGSYLPSSASGTVIVFAFPSRGAFVLGNRTVAAATPATNLTWWSSTWYLLNSLSGGTAPSAFKGFAGVVATLPTSSPPSSCTGTWTSLGGNSPPPPATAPSYMGVIVATKISKAGSGIKGDFSKIVVVKTNPGYAPNPMNAGTGKIVATFCP